MSRRSGSVAIAGVATLALTACSGTGPALTGGTTTGGPSTAAVAPTAALAADPDGVAPAPPRAADPAAMTSAVRFLRAWARPDLPADRWWAGFRPYAIPAYADLLATVDPANVPATRITGSARAAAATAERVDVDVPTDVGVLRVVCVAIGGRWLVATIGVADKAEAS
ncbi:hypothetical protein [Micromonospora sp. NPDC051141]|uniref:hypothetical protein n=1 Tax=Micromonospora sp. NPDC051141 TaxID=3364284 RepID=UPI0037B76273